MTRKLIHILSLALAQLVCASAFAIVSPGEYYIVNDFYNKGLNGQVNNNAYEIWLSTYNADNDDAFIFIAEQASGNYVKLKNKATGKYLAASASSSYAMELTDDGSGDRYMWSLDTRFSTPVVCKKASGKRLGCDYANASLKADTNVGVYYDKNKGALSWFSVIPANGEGFEASRAAFQSESYTNEYGVSERDAYQVSTSVSVSGEDFHIFSETPFNGGTVNLSGDKAWLIFEHVRPTTVINNWLGNVTIDGAPAANGTNCRVEIWLDGAAVIPTPSTAPFVGSTPSGSVNLEIGNSKTLGSFNNQMTSFTLRRGYMATVASGTNGGGYSRVYVADHSDLNIELPNALAKRVSSVNVRKWHYVGKRGYGHTGDVQYQCWQNHSSWGWNWDANHTTNADVEYIPIKQHKYWPGDGNINQQNSTAMMLINEPEHSEQHTSSKCTCGGTTNEWDAYKLTTNYNSNGMRIGSPSATDFNWLKTYAKHCDDMAQRCDIICTHGYWLLDNWSGNINTVWNNCKRPIWITEWEVGASWLSYAPSSEEDYAKKVLTVLDMMEYDDRVERYAYYGSDLGGTNGWMRAMFYEDNPSKGLTQTGNLYKRIKTNFAYSANRAVVPNWWAPGVGSVEVSEATKLPDGSYRITLKNDNDDATEQIKVMTSEDGTSWADAYTESNRSLFDGSTMSFVVPESVISGKKYVRVSLTTIYGGNAESKAFEIPTYATMDDLTNLTFDEGTFTTQSIVTYAKDKTTAEPLFNMQPVDGWNIPLNGDARASGMIKWGANVGIGGKYYLPAKDSNGNTSGGGIGIVAVWTAQAQYTQNVELPAGEYTITVPVYNIGDGTNFAKNLIGFIETDGTEHLAKATSYAKGKWTIETITFTLDHNAPGYLSLGYTANDIGSKDAAHLVFDYIKVTLHDDTPVTLAQSTLDLLEGNTATLATATAPVGALEWKSSDTSVATVDANGLVSAIGIGTAIITVTADNNGTSAQCTVNVAENVQTRAAQFIADHSDVLNADPVTADHLEAIVQALSDIEIYSNAVQKELADTKAKLEQMKLAAEKDKADREAAEEQKRQEEEQKRQEEEAAKALAAEIEAYREANLDLFKDALVTADDLADIEAALTAYDALSDKAKEALADMKSTLDSMKITAEKDKANREAEEEQKRQEEEAAKALAAEIENYRTANARALALDKQTVTADDAADVDAALEAYDALSDKAKTALADEKARLDALKTAIDEVITSIDTATLSQQQTEMYNLRGQRVNSSYHGIVIINGKKVYRR